MRGRTALAAGCCFAAAVGATLTALRWRFREPELPFPPPPGVSATAQYVGVETCATCHAEKVAAHALSGHSHTFSASRDSAIAKRMDGRRFRDPERGYEYLYHFGPEGLSVSVPERFGKKEFPLEYVFGSGTHAVNFLTLVPNRAGETTGLEHRVTAFGKEERLSLTPGQRGQTPGQDVEHFGIVVPPGHDVSRCVGCHTTTARIEERQVKDLIPNVMCESCHGPGSRHVAAMRLGGNHPNLEIQARWSAQEQLEMCGRCHRRTDWLDRPPQRTDLKIVRFQPVGLSQSKCYTQSAGRMSCTTCHDPHEPASTDRIGYDQQCLKCHTPANAPQVPCPVSPREKCVECHMPRIEIHKGFVVSDHWIRVRKPDDLPAYDPQAKEPAKK